MTRMSSIRQNLDTGRLTCTRCGESWDEETPGHSLAFEYLRAGCACCPACDGYDDEGHPIYAPVVGDGTFYCVHCGGSFIDSRMATVYVCKDCDRKYPEKKN